MSVRRIALLTGLSPATVSRSLRGNLKVADDTRQRVLQAAHEVGYDHNPLIGSMMSALRKRDSQAFRGNLALLVKSSRPGLLEDNRVADVVRGACQRAEQLGFAIDRSDLEEIPPAALQRILIARGVVGILVFMPSYGGAPETLEMDFSKFCFVAAGWGLWKPQMDTVQVDYHQTIRLILEKSVPTFGSGIAAIWDYATDEASHRVARGTFLTHHPGGVSLAEKLFLSRQEASPERLAKLVLKHGIQSLILGSSYAPPDWLADVHSQKEMDLVSGPGQRSPLWLDQLSKPITRRMGDQLAGCQVANEPDRSAEKQAIGSGAPFVEPGNRLLMRQSLKSNSLISSDLENPCP